MTEDIRERLHLEATTTRTCNASSDQHCAAAQLLAETTRIWTGQTAVMDRDHGVMDRQLSGQHCWKRQRLGTCAANIPLGQPAAPGRLDTLICACKVCMTMESLKQYGKGTRDSRADYHLQIAIAHGFVLGDATLQLSAHWDWTRLDTCGHQCRTLYSMPSKINQLKACTASWCADI